MRWFRLSIVLPVALAALVAFVPLVSGCGAIPIDYTPSASLSPAEAKFIVLQVLEEQPRALALAEVEVTYDKITVVHAQTGRKTVIYFNSVSGLDLHIDSQRDLYVVRIFETAGGYRLRLWTRDVDKGKRFMDGVETLVAHARARRDDAELRAKEERLQRLREITGEIDQIRRERADDQEKELELEAEEPIETAP